MGGARARRRRPADRRPPAGRGASCDRPERDHRAGARRDRRGARHHGRSAAGGRCAGNRRRHRRARLRPPARGDRASREAAGRADAHSRDGRHRCGAHRGARRALPGGGEAGARAPLLRAPARRGPATRRRRSLAGGGLSSRHRRRRDRPGGRIVRHGGVSPPPGRRARHQLGSAVEGLPRSRPAARPAGVLVGPHPDAREGMPRDLRDVLSRAAPARVRASGGCSRPPPTSRAWPSSARARRRRWRRRIAGSRRSPRWRARWCASDRGSSRRSTSPASWNACASSPPS